MNVGIIGIGGLGQMGVRLAKAMGNTVTAISTSPNKEAAAREIGADNFVVSTSPESMAAAAGSLDLILNTVAANHDLNTYLGLLAGGGVLVQLGLVLAPHSVNQVVLMMRKLTISGSLIGGIPETQDCINFCHKHNIVPKIKTVTWGDLDQVYQDLSSKNDSIIRLVMRSVFDIYLYKFIILGMSLTLRQAKQHNSTAASQIFVKLINHSFKIHIILSSRYYSMKNKKYVNRRTRHEHNTGAILIKLKHRKRSTKELSK